MSILNKLKTLELAKSEGGRTPMTAEQVKACKEAIRTKNRGYNVHPNQFDINKPYKVAINYNNTWSNFGEFKSADVAAAVGTIVSAAYFGDKAKAGQFNQELVEQDEAFKAWLEDERNQDVIARANGDKEVIHNSPVSPTNDNPF